MEFSSLVWLALSCIGPIPCQCILDFIDLRAAHVYYDTKLLCPQSVCLDISVRPILDIEGKTLS